MTVYTVEKGCPNCKENQVNIMNPSCPIIYGCINCGKMYNPDNV